MNKLIIAIACVTLFSACQTSDSKLPENPGAKIQISKDTVNVGYVKVGDSVLTSVEVSNLGKDSLKILKLGSSSGCTAGIVKKHTLGNGEKATLDITYRNDGDLGEILKTIVLESNSPEPFKVLHIIGTGVPK